MLCVLIKGLGDDSVDKVLAAQVWEYEFKLQACVKNLCVVVYSCNQRIREMEISRSWKLLASLSSKIGEFQATERPRSLVSKNMVNS